jgi:septum formation protein
VTGAPRIVLASASPRRAQLLRRLGLQVQVSPAEVDERYLPGEEPEAHVERLARTKAETVAGRVPGALVVAGDTVVVRDGVVLGKPADAEEAVAMLRSLAGRRHIVLSGIALYGPRGMVSAVGRATVRFRAFDEDEARAYVATGEPMDKAGAYGIQGMGGALVEGIEGDYYTVVGFPVATFIELLARAGWRYAYGRLEAIA